MKRPLGFWMVSGFLFAVACGSDFDPASQVKTLRIIAVEADKSYAQPGDGVTLSMTYAGGATSRSVQVTWFKPCDNPEGASYVGCLKSLANEKTETLEPDKSGVIGSATFALSAPRDIVEHAPSGTIAACASRGQLRAGLHAALRVRGRADQRQPAEPRIDHQQ